MTASADRTSRGRPAVARPATSDAPSRAVFERFYRQHFVGAWRALGRLGVSSGECEDAAQEVFVSAHRRWAAFDDALPRRAWLFGIVRKIAWRYRRSDERRVRRIDAIAREQIATLSLDDLIAREEAARMLAAFLETLDADKREAFVLGELEELGRRELGHALGVNPNTAYSRLQAARRRFLEHFAALDDDACAVLLAHADATTVPERGDDRAWSRLALLVWPRASVAIAPMSFGAAAVLAIAVLLPTRVDDAPHASASTPVVQAVVDDVAVVLPAVIEPPPRAGSAPTDAVPTAAKRRAKATKAPPPRAQSPSDDDQLALLVRAREAMLVGDPARARRLLDEHTACCERSSLASVRDAIARDLAALVITPRDSGDSPSR